MKTPILIFTLALLTSPAARAAGPDYKIPRGATSQPENCTVTELARVPEGGGWSDWQASIKEDRHQTTYWNDGDTFYSLERADDGSRVVHSQFREELIDRRFTHRDKTVTTWTKRGSAWSREETRFAVLIERTEGSPVRVTETGGGKTYIWETRTIADGDDQITERRLLNPNVLNEAARKVASYAEHCLFRLSPVLRRE